MRPADSTSPVSSPDDGHGSGRRHAPTPVEVTPRPMGGGRVPSRGDITLSFDGEWDPSVLGRAMASVGMAPTTPLPSDGTASRWAKAADRGQAYPLLVDASVNEAGGSLRLMGFVMDDDGRTRLTIDGDDGAPHHAKSGALADFEAICDALRKELEWQDEETVLAPGQGQPESRPWQAQALQQAPPLAGPHPQPTQGQRPPVITQPIAPQGLPQGMPSGVPTPQQAPNGYGYPQPPQQSMPARQAEQWQQAPPTQRQQFGYGSPDATSQQGQPSVAPGWAVQSVPNRCWMYIAISCVELILLVAESLYINYLVSLFPVLFLSWPAIPAIALSVSYKRAFQAGNAQLALLKMRQARGWIIGAAVWCLVRVLFKLTMCSGMY